MSEPKRRCPQCSSVCDADTGLETTKTPSPGDVSICLYCSGISIFVDNGAYSPTLRRATDDELEELLRDPLIRNAAYAIGSARKRGLVPLPDGARDA